MKTICITQPEARRLLDAGSIMIVRPLRRQPHASPWNLLPDYTMRVAMIPVSDGIQARFSHRIPQNPNEDSVEWISAPFVPGQTVGLRETWAAVFDSRWRDKPQNPLAGKDGLCVIYQSDEPGWVTDSGEKPDWKSPAIQPTWAIRPAFRACPVRSVECKRVGEITDDEAIAAGCDPQPAYCEHCQIHLCSQHQPPLGQFHNAWRDRYGKAYPFETAYAWFSLVEIGGKG